MIVSVTVLGSNDGTAPEIIGKRIAEYLEGGRTRAAGGRRPGEAIGLPASTDTAAYWADSAGLRPGRWVLGPASMGRSGVVDATELATILAGIDPVTGEPLIAATGSAGRAARQRGGPLSPVDLDKDWYSVNDAAAVLGIKSRYLRRLCRKEVLAGTGEEPGITLDARGRWQLSRQALLRIDSERTPPEVVGGYDLTFSPPKSLSVLWAVGDEATRAAVLDALDESVAAGLRYPERHTLSVRVKGQSELA